MGFKEWINRIRENKQQNRLLDDERLKVQREAQLEAIHGSKDALVQQYKQQEVEKTKNPPKSVGNKIIDELKKMGENSSRNLGGMQSTKKFEETHSTISKESASKLPSNDKLAELMGSSPNVDLSPLKRKGGNIEAEKLNHSNKKLKGLI